MKVSFRLLTISTSLVFLFEGSAFANYNTDKIAGDVTCQIPDVLGTVSITADRSVITLNTRSVHNYVRPVTKRTSDDSTVVDYVCDDNAMNVIFSDRGDAITLWGRTLSLACPQ
jgi:hypothetical protein